MDFGTELRAQLIMLDAREIEKERVPNIYRIGLYLEAAEYVEELITDGASREEAFTIAFTPTRGIHTVARKLGLAIDVERGQWILPEKEPSR